MLDLSPEKLVVLLAVGLVVLGPDKLPGAARNLAHARARVRRLGASLTDPIATHLAEPARAITEPIRTGLTQPLEGGLAQPRRAVDDALATLRSTIADHPAHPVCPQPPADPSLN